MDSLLCHKKKKKQANVCNICADEATEKRERSSGHRCSVFGVWCLHGAARPDAEQVQIGQQNKPSVTGWSAGSGIVVR